jgi:O-antigen ligase
LPKIAILSVLLASILFRFALIRNWELLFSKHSFQLSFFLAAIMIVLLANISNPAERIFGVYGRNNGAITFVMLGIIAYLYLQIGMQFTGRFLNYLLLINLLSLFYGVMQFNGFDIYDWQLKTRENSVFAFFGNPNFFSGFLAYSGLSILQLITYENIVRFKRVAICCLVLILNISTLIITGSALGLFGFVIGLMFFVTTFTWKSANLRNQNSKSFNYVFSITFLVIITLLVYFSLTLNLIDLQGSVYRRVDFWQTALRIFESSSIVGRGFDSYSGLFLQYSSNNPSLQNIHSSSAHSFFFDILASGGFILSLAYMTILVSVFKRIFISLKNLRELNPQYLLIMGMWISYLVQSSISVPTISVDLWGWAMTGMLLSLPSKKIDPKSRKSGNILSKRITWSGLMLIIANFLFFSGFKLYQYDSNFSKLARAGDGSRLAQSVLLWPQNSYYIFLTAEGLRNANEIRLAQEIEDAGLRLNPQNFLLVRLISEKELDPQKRMDALDKLTVLDPNFVPRNIP